LDNKWKEEQPLPK